MKLFTSRSGLLTGHSVAQLNGIFLSMSFFHRMILIDEYTVPQYLTRLPRHPAVLGFNRPAQQQWQRRTLVDTPKPSLPDQIRLLMRRVPYPVAIITATDPHTHNHDHKDTQIEHSYRGMTVSSFSTVTLHPEPVVSFNVKRPSETLNALLSSGRFLVHLLAPARPTADLARDFSRGNNNLSIVNGEGGFEFAAHAQTGDEKESERPLPLLRRREVGSRGIVDFPFVFECRLLPQQMEVFDHTIVLGRVVDTILQRPLDAEVKGQADSGELCLTYANTKFWEMGHEIKG